MVDINERAASARRKYRTQNNLNYLQAILGRTDNTIPDANQPGNVWVRIVSSNGLLNDRSVRAPTKYFPLEPGLPVTLCRDRKGRLQVDEPDADTILATGINPVSRNIAQSSPSTPQVNFETMRCVPNEPPDTFVNVKAWNVIVDGIAYQFPGASIDLSGVIPAAGDMARIVVAVKNDYFTLESSSSTPRSMTDVPLGLADLQEALDGLSVGSVPSQYIDLEDAQANISSSDVLQDGDLRNMVNTSPWVAVPTTHTDPGVPGEMAYDSSYLYVCIATDTWKRTALSTW